METPIVIFYPVILGCSYPTYEEWKLHPQQVHQHRILRSYPTYEEWKQKGRLLSLYQIVVLILPMRNGNSTVAILIRLFIKCSYPTYEEWKPFSATLIVSIHSGSYPTYEEWKPSSSLKPQ